MPRTVSARVLCVLLGLALIAPAGASASDIVYGTTSTSLVRFNASSPQTIDATLPLQGLPAGVTIAGLDERPESTSLYALGSDGRLYRVGKTTGVAEALGIGGLTTPQTGAIAIDFNPTVNRLRIVSSDDLNVRQNPNTGAQVDGDAVTGGIQPDTPLNPPSDVAGIAYDRNFVPATLTTLWGIDAGTDSLVRIGGIDGTPSPNGGAVTVVGPVGRDVTLDADLDIARSGVMYASLPSAGNAAPVLARIDQLTGAATVIGPIGAPVTQIAVADPPRVVYVHGGGTLLEVPGDATAAAATAVALQVPAGQVITGLETRPATGELLALSDQGIVYRVNRVTGALTPLGQPAATGPAVADAGFDVNPVTDRLRITTLADQNVALAAFAPPFSSTAGAALVYDAADPNAGQNPSVIATAFGGVAPDGTTTGFGLDVGLDVLVRETAPGSGVLQTVRSAELDYSPGAAFDLPATGSAGYSVTRLAGSGNAHLVWFDARTVTTTNHQSAVDLGELRVAGAASPTYNGAAIAPYGTASVPATTSADEGEGVARVIVVRAGGNRGAANVEYDVAAETATAGVDVTVAAGTVTFEDGEQTATIEVPITDDTTVEGPETFTVTIARPGGAVTLDSDELSTRVTILSDDPVSPAPAPPPGPATTTVFVPAPPVPDRTRPVGLAAIAAQRLGAVRSSGLRLRLLVSEALTARIVATVDGPTRRRLGLPSTIVTSRTTATYIGPQARSLRLRLTAAAKRRLASARSVRLTVVATLTDRAGNVATVRERVTLRR